jgi:hypothetical protein
VKSFDPEALTEQSNERLNESAQRDPRVCGWGLFAWGDAPPACGGGCGCFQWFASRSELLEFITDWSAAGFMTFDEESEWLQQRDCLRAIAAGMNDDPAGQLQGFNEELRGLLQIDWIGTYGELLAGEHPFSRRILKAFSEEQDRPFEPVAIQSEEAFLAFLRNYGC